VMAGMTLLGVAALGVFLLARKKLGEATWFLRLLPWCIPVPFFANEIGWIGTEIGRQPWMIYKVLRTADASSAHLPVWQAQISLAVLCCVYVLLALLAAWFVKRVMSHGPQAHA
jgi:cytochrome bd ubiquinol oxidase subunit I